MRDAVTVMLDRRCFLSGAFSMFGSLLLPGVALPPVKPNLVFGVISDTHLRRDPKREKPAKSFPTAYLRKTLEYFRENDVDAVVHCGDFADWGFACEMRFHADVWYGVFPDDKGNGGKRVEKLFVTGNHDWVGSTYANNVGARMFPDAGIRKGKVFAGNQARLWKECWREPYERLWHKSVKGYHFFGSHFEGHYNGIDALVKKEAVRLGLRGPRPFFVLQHMIPREPLKAVLKDYPNAVSLFGHWHSSIASDRTIVYDGFPMVQCASLRNNKLTSVPGFKIEGKFGHRTDMRQGMLVRVYDDRVVFSRRDFFHGGSLGPDWTMPFGAYDPHPLSAEGLAKSEGAPAFDKEAELKAVRKGDALAIEIPPAFAQPTARAYAYDIVVKGDEGQPKWRSCVYAAGCDFAVDFKEAQGPTKVTVPAAKLPQGKELLVAVRPVSSLGKCGAPISAKVPA